MALSLILGGFLFFSDELIDHKSSEESNPKYYVIVMCHQNRNSMRAIPSKAHSFAVFVKSSSENQIDEYFTISWCTTQGVRIFGEAQRGVNLSLEETIDNAFCRGLCVKRWGPFEMDPCHFEEAKSRYQSLEEAESDGSIRWKCIDKFTRFRACKPAFNCMHAISDITCSVLRTGVHCGEKGSRLVVDHFIKNRVIVDACNRHDWVWEAISPEEFHTKVELEKP